MEYRIIIPLDGSKLSEQATTFGASLARAVGGYVVLTHVVGGPALPPRAREASTEEGKALAYLKRVAHEMADNIHIATSIAWGHAAQEIVAMAAALPKTIIVISTHGRGDLGRMVFGSVADEVMRRSTVPVVLIPVGVTRKALAIRNLLVPLDGSELAETVLPLAAGIALGAGAALHVVRVVEPFWSQPASARGGVADYLTADQVAAHDREQSILARSYLCRVASEIEDQGVHPVWNTHCAKPADGIVDAATECDADLILMASHGLGGVKRWAFGSVASEVVHRKVAPVLVMPSAARVAERNEESLDLVV